MTSGGSDFPQLLQNFFLQRLIAQRGASQQTIASYRDAFELLLRFAEKRTGRTASSFALSDLDAPLILDFLDHLEQERGNSTRTRNARLAAIRSFMRYAGLKDPTALPVVQRILAIPAKHFDKPEITALRVADVLLERQTSLLLHGKGRKERVVPLWSSTATQLRAWLKHIDRRSDGPVFPNRTGKALSRSGVRQRLESAVAKATEHCQSLEGRRVSPHTLRHTTAMHLLQSGVDLTVIALLLGHEDPSTTHQYLEADLAMKKAALERIQHPTVIEPLFQPSKRVLAFLDAL